MIQANEILIIAVVALIFLGPQRLPVAARTIGKAFREFRKISTTVRHEIDEAVGEPMKEFKDTIASLDPTRPDPAQSSSTQSAQTPGAPRDDLAKPNSAYRPADEMIDDLDDVDGDSADPDDSAGPDSAGPAGGAGS